MAFFEAHCDNNCKDCSQYLAGKCLWEKSQLNLFSDGHRQLFVDNSAPCSHCVYLKRATLECEFPEGYKKECSVNSGRTKGWNTIEYVKKLSR